MTSIEWTDEVWNPTVGCSRVSPGCTRCYAEKFVHRGLVPEHRGLTVLREKAGVGWTGDVRFLADRLTLPQTWKRGRRIFVNSLSDVFHENLSHEQRAAIFGAMLMAPRHTYQILTKRPQVAVAFEQWLRDSERADGREWWERCFMAAVAEGARVSKYDGPSDRLWVRDFVSARKWWIGCTMEDQARVDERMPLLLSLSILPTKKIVSYEPALEAVDFGLQSATCGCCRHLRWASRWVWLHRGVEADYRGVNGLKPLRAHDTFAPSGVYRARGNAHGALSVVAHDGRLLGIKPAEFVALKPPDWIIVGGESGAGARPFKIEWMRSAIEQCRVGGVPVFCKQLGANVRTRNDDNFTIDEEPPDPDFPYWPGDLVSADRLVDNPNGYREEHQGAPVRVLLRNRKGGDPSEWPADLRAREFPEVAHG